MSAANCTFRVPLGIFPILIVPTLCVGMQTPPLCGGRTAMPDRSQHREPSNTSKQVMPLRYTYRHSHFTPFR